MTRVLFDNNIWISFLIGKRLNTLFDVFGRPDIIVCYCASRPRILKRKAAI